MVAAALAVEVGLKLPHCELPQVTDHVTPASALSLLTVAVNNAVALTVIELGGVFSVTEIGVFAGEIVIVVVADLVESETEVAVIVTLDALATVAGAENLVVAPLAVEAAEKLPHAEPVHDHLTPALALSLLTTAAMLTDVPASIDDGGTGLIDTEITGGFGVLEDEPPQPATVIAKANAARRLKIEYRFTWCPHKVRRWLRCCARVMVCEQEIRTCCGS